MTHSDVGSHVGLGLGFYLALSLAGPAGCNGGRPSADEAGVKAARHQRQTGRAVGIILDEVSAAKGLNGAYSDGQRTLRFETVRQPMERGALQPPLERDYYIALRVIDSTGRTFLILSEDKIPSHWVREAQPAPGREQPVEPEMLRLALEAAQAVKQLKLPRDLQPEQALLAQQLALFGSHPVRLPPREPPANAGP
jgi:hypothetical protein